VEPASCNMKRRPYGDPTGRLAYTAVARCAVWRRSFGPIPTFTTFETMNIAIKYNRKGRPIFGTLWQRLWWGLGCWSHEDTIVSVFTGGL
jgi:hypothetical protein